MLCQIKINFQDIDQLFIVHPVPIILNPHICYRLTYVRSVSSETEKGIDCVAISPTMGDIAFCSEHGE